jgi:hypothetical protein
MKKDRVRTDALTCFSSCPSQHGFTLQGVPLCLGRLESSDFAPLPAQRKEAVQAFWAAYFAAAGESAEIQFDGAGILSGASRVCFSGKL